MISTDTQPLSRESKISLFTLNDAVSVEWNYGRQTEVVRGDNLTQGNALCGHQQLFPGFSGQMVD